MLRDLARERCSSATRLLIAVLPLYVRDEAGLGALVRLPELSAAEKQEILETFDIARDLFQSTDIHIHVPAGAIPKDGPSAGIAIYAAAASLLNGCKVRADVAMTGEISLRGLVLPVGGIKEKVLAAHAAGIRTAILPARNQKDLEEIPQSVRKDVRFTWVETVAQVLRIALLPAETPPETYAG